MNVVDPLLHIPLAAIVGLLFWIEPGLGAAAYLWTREAAQKDKHDFLRGMDPRDYSLQRHMEIWPPALAVSLLWHFGRHWLTGLAGLFL